MLGEPHRVEPALVHDLDALQRAGENRGERDPPLRPAEELQDAELHGFASDKPAVLVIPGRRAAANPEAMNTGRCAWIPGSASGRPGMTTGYSA